MSIFIMMLGLKIVMGSHFRGGIIQWRPLNAQNFDGRVSLFVCLFCLFCLSAKTSSKS